MREIKFRAWDSIEGVMIYSGDEAADFEVMDGLVIVRCCTTQWKEGGGELFEVDTWLEINVEVMQFTGLKDKNGKEIYEGDMLENPEGKKGIVVFHDGSFVLQIHKSKTSVHYITMNQGYCNNKSIVGNIYESICPECNGTGSYEGKTGGEGIPEADVMFVCGECKGTGKA